jgi:hypothetical protein
MSGNNQADRIKELEERLEEANFRADRALDEQVACEKKYDKLLFDTTNKYDALQKTLMEMWASMKQREDAMRRSIEEISAGMGLKKGGSRRRRRLSSRKH